jgi:transcriptional regulator with XRE-family HTH domain
MPRTLPRPIDTLSPLARDMAALGILVRNRRAQSKLRIDDAANMLGVSKDVLSRIENGRSVSMDKVFTVLNGLGLNMLVFDKRTAPAVLRKFGPTAGEPDDVAGGP